MKPEETGSATTYDPSAIPTDPTAMLHMFGPYVAAFAVIGLALFIFGIFIQWKIFSKAGYSGALALTQLLLIIPLINFIGIFVVAGIWIWFAFADWPVLKKARGEAAPIKT